MTRFSSQWASPFEALQQPQALASGVVVACMPAGLTSGGAGFPGATFADIYRLAYEQAVRSVRSSWEYRLLNPSLN